MPLEEPVVLAVSLHANTQNEGKLSFGSTSESFQKVFKDGIDLNCCLPSQFSLSFLLNHLGYPTRPATSWLFLGPGFLGGTFYASGLTQVTMSLDLLLLSLMGPALTHPYLVCVSDGSQASQEVGRFHVQVAIDREELLSGQSCKQLTDGGLPTTDGTTGSRVKHEKT